MVVRFCSWCCGFSRQTLEHLLYRSRCSESQGYWNKCVSYSMCYSGNRKFANVDSIRIPIGFWAYDNAGTPYIKGADAYLEKAIGWAKAAGIRVWIDLHGCPGSQNGFDNSGHAGAVEWQRGDNINRTINVLTTMAQ